MPKSHLTNTYLTEEEYLGYFQRFLEQRTEDMLAYVNACMKHDGDTEATSQRICLLNAINEVEHLINGTTLDDLKISEDD